MNLAAPFIARPVATTLLLAAILLGGVLGLLRLPVSPLPRVELPTILVQAQQPGASPAVMASSVAAPLERRLATIADLEDMTSQSFSGLTRITLQFGLNRSIDGAARDVQAAIAAARAELPTSLRNNPSYRKVNPADAPILVLTLTSATLTPAALFDAADGIVRQRLSTILGVGDVDIAGASLPAVRIEANPQALSALGIGMEGLRAAIAAANPNSPKGAIEAQGRRLQIATNDDARRAADYRQLLVGWRDGAPVRLTDVAAVTDGTENLRDAALADGTPAILVLLYRQPGGNVIDIVDKVKALLPELSVSLPGDTAIGVAVDRSLTIRASLSDMQLALVIAIALVVLVVRAFLGTTRAAMIPSVAVIASILGTFGAMALFGYSLNNLSLMALIVATGFVVDDAIVVLENIERHMGLGLSPTAAALRGTREVGFTVVAISVSLVAALLPVLLMEGVIGRMFREFAATLSFAILISMLVSLTATPMMCAVLLRPQLESAPRAGWRSALLSAYAFTLRAVLRRPLSGAVCLVAATAASVLLFAAVPKSLFPQQDTGQLVGGIVGDQTASFQSMRAKLERYEQVLRDDPAVDRVVGLVGARQANAGTLFVALKPLAERKVSADTVIARLRPRLAELPGARLYLKSEQDIRLGGRPGNGQFQFVLHGDDADAVAAEADRLLPALRGSTSLVDVNSDQQRRGLAADLTIDRAASAARGLTPAQIDNALYDAFGQRQVSVIHAAFNQYHVVLEAAPAFWENPSMLDRLFVGTGGAMPAGTQQTRGIAAGGTTSATAIPTVADATRELANNAISAAGRMASSAAPAVSLSREPMVPLAGIAHWKSGTSPLVVTHQGLDAAATISFNLPPGGAIEDAVRTIENEVSTHPPERAHWNFAGAAAAFTDAQRSEVVLLAAAVLVVYLVLGILYESFLHPLTVLSTLPPAAAGAMFAVWVTGGQFNTVSLVGVILLIGIVKKNGILLIDFAISRQRTGSAVDGIAGGGLAAGSGEHATDAILAASLARIRPITMTTLAAVLGAVPLLLGGAEGAELRQPLGLTVIGGLLFSQILTLYITPSIYVLLSSFTAGPDTRRRPA
jgi:multidrug efflux pump